MITIKEFVANILEIAEVSIFDSWKHRRNFLAIKSVKTPAVKLNAWLLNYRSRIHLEGKR